ncbi:MAG: hypothetical protein JWL85_296 [Candidatus Saccharibacteria bacterium]|nr:hypothetical protein [Candidatus Saccharibacteria bacterium]
MTATNAVSQERLLRALAEQLKLPLLHIARQAELAAMTGSTSVPNTTITQTASMALQLIDGYLLSTDLHAQQSLHLEPVSISSVLHDTAQRLQFLARQYNCEVEIHLAGKYEPVMGHRESLETAFTMLGYSFIESITEGKDRRLVLAAHRSGKGLVAGVFGNHPGLTADMYRRARALYGNSRQALPTVSPASGAGVFIADSLLAPSGSPLRVARHQKLNGLAATLFPSQQMQLV